MKKYLHLYLLLFLPLLYTSQSISASKLLDYINIQNSETITKELKQLGFQTRVDNSEGYPIYRFAKETSRGIEKIEVGKNTELFMITYRPEYTAYEILRNKILTSDFQYAYSYKSTKYYENSTMRIGADNTNGIISVFKQLK
ncbi:hypothetical protein [Chryseobacterium sp. G0201]|uniref:hypothetical protein n=1 Tax=Chryseobacterium sp. G0201 TaxID=2487065 RepID=UPI000F4E6499|nr:hypothetical protein [Chryseobacterium sp. G0201]AZA52759.1 hypothetical protein EG348_06945 [Chryseobacterium sp. G0201]